MAEGASAFGALRSAVRQVAERLGADGSAADELASFVNRRLSGDYAVDGFGFDAELTERVLLPVLRPLYRRWFRVQVRGVGHLPATGAGLVVANHSGAFPVDALMTQLAVRDEHPRGRHLRVLAATVVFELPFVADLARRGGVTLACPEDAAALLGRGELVGVWPEGVKGTSKPYAQRYQLQRFGRGGFVSTALRAGVPIVPCAIVGAEEAYPLLLDAAPVARALRLPYFPITPTFPWLGPLGLVPLPSKWMIEFCESIPVDGYPPEAADDATVVTQLTEQVREVIRHTLDELLERRGSAFGWAGTATVG